MQNQSKSDVLKTVIRGSIGRTIILL